MLPRCFAIVTDSLFFMPMLSISRARSPPLRLYAAYASRHVLIALPIFAMMLFFMLMPPCRYAADACCHAAKSAIAFFFDAAFRYC